MFRRGKLNFLSTKDDRIKVMNERINLTEKHLMEMCAAFASCTRKMAKQRDAFDELSHKVKYFADEEKINYSLSDGLNAITSSITIQADYMDLLVHRLEMKIVNELSQFENLCKTTRDNLRTAAIARDKEVLKQQQLLEIKSKFSANNSAADSELLKAKMEVNRTNKEIVDVINNFEKRKLGDLKKLLSDFILISIKYHTKALEALSASYYDVSNIDEKGDFNEFQKLMKTKSEPAARKLTLKKGLRSQSMDSLEHDQLLSPLKRRAKVSRSNKSLAKTDDEQEEHGDNDDDDDEEEDDDDEELEDEDSADNSNAADDHTGTASEDESASISETKAPPAAATHKQIKEQSNKQPFRAVAATHVLQAQQKPFTVKGGIGIPALNKRHPTTAHFGIKEKTLKQSPSNVTMTLDGGGSRLVTVVESKN